MFYKIYSQLIRNFSVCDSKTFHSSDTLAIERIREVFTYTEEHFKEPLSLDNITELLGLGKEHFCRFFFNMRTSYLNYLNKVRLAHAFQNLVNTDIPISEVMEINGFSNQKLFNKTFKQLYGCTPSSVRKEYCNPD